MLRKIVEKKRKIMICNSSRDLIEWDRITSKEIFKCEIKMCKKL